VAHPLLKFLHLHDEIFLGSAQITQSTRTHAADRLYVSPKFGHFLLEQEEVIQVVGKLRSPRVSVRQELIQSRLQCRNLPAHSLYLLILGGHISADFRLKGSEFSRLDTGRKGHQSESENPGPEDSSDLHQPNLLHVMRISTEQ
jgi:hypothetical protein